MKCLSQSLCVVLITGIHPDQSRTTLASSTDLDEHKVTGFACSPHLVSVPSDNGSGVVAGADDFELSHGDVGDATAQGQDVEAKNAALGAHLFGEDVHRPN